MPYSNVNMLINHMIARQKHMSEASGSFRKNFLQENSDDSGNLRMVETRIYVGLNDAETKQQKYETDQYKALLKKVCCHYHVPFSVGIEEGGYYHEDGEYTEEQTLVLTLIDAEKYTVRRIAQDLCTFFHQESVLITEDDVKGFYFMEKEGH